MFAKLITTKIDPFNLAATAGMFLEHCSNKDLSQEFSHQVLHQLGIQGVDADTILKSKPKDLPMVSFQLPIVVLMEVADSFLGLVKTKHRAAVAVLMKAWSPALVEATVVMMGKSPNDESDGLFFDGRCMN